MRQVERRPAQATDPEQQFRSFVGEVSPRLLGAALLMTGDLGSAEDLVQESLLRVYRSWSRIDDPVAAPAYAYRTLTRLAWRRVGPLRAWRFSLSPSMADGVSLSDDLPWESREAVRAALATVPRRQRQTLVLRYYAGLSVDETARAMGCSTGSVKSQTSDGLRRMRSALVAADQDVFATPTTTKG
ncbi:MAG TPA: SigE family RNA polymerase sigma factor [Jatrophihabitantaceae bacterium]|nr:SigE family RNA polymerase sigma factor [Jatrophihabitantaceae bacterium]